MLRLSGQLWMKFKQKNRMAKKSTVESVTKDVQENTEKIRMLEIKDVRHCQFINKVIN